MIKIPKVTAVIPLKEYAEGFGEETLSVWLNPSLDLVNERIELLRESLALMSQKANKENMAENIAAQNAHVERWLRWLPSVIEDLSADEINAAYIKDPAFVSWISNRITRLMDEHRANKKKASMTL